AKQRMPQKTVIRPNGVIKIAIHYVLGEREEAEHNPIFSNAPSRLALDGLQDTLEILGGLPLFTLWYLRECDTEIGPQSLLKGNIGREILLANGELER